MKIQEYHPATRELLQDSATGVSFGNVLRANHCDRAIVLRPMATTEATLSEMKVYLQSRGPLSESEFGFFTSGTLVTGIEPGDDVLSGNFQGAVSGNAFAIPDGHYAWLDVQAGPNETGTASVNFRFTYDYN